MLQSLSQILLVFFFLLFSLEPSTSLDNGLARTPPMGWMSWTKFTCQTDCKRHPFSCINEQLYKDMGDRLAEDGYREAGYQSVHIDDCWMEKQRDHGGKLVPDRARFPSGMKALADYMHERKLLLGIYEDVGTQTCAKYPGSLGHFEEDAQTFAEWGADYLKLDGCFLDVDMFPKVYPEMSVALNRSGRGIVYSCSWPDYLPFHSHQEKINYSAIANSCNLWRNFDDIELSWGSVLKIIEWYTLNQDILRPIHRPGQWNDPDMLIVGNTELSVDQAKAQMSIWAIWSAPLLMSNDLRTIAPEYKEILLNRRVIAVDQDPLGEFGRMVFKSQTVYVYVKRVLPADLPRQLYSHAVAVLNYGFKPIIFSTDLRSIGLTNPEGYSLLDLWSGQDLGHFGPLDVYNVTLAPTSVSMVKASLPGAGW